MGPKRTALAAATAAAIAVVALGCGGGTSGKLTTRGDRRLARGEPLEAIADDDGALAATSGASSARGDDLRARRDYAAAGLVRMELADARDAFSEKKYEAAFEKLWALHKTRLWGARELDEQVIKAMADAVAELWPEVDAFASDHHYDLAVVRAEYLVTPFPAGHSHRARLEALLDESLAFHQHKLDTVENLPGAAAFHYAMTRRLGGLRAPRGETAMRAYASSTGTVDDAMTGYGHALRAGNEAAAENYLMLAYKFGNDTMPAEALAWFGERYGLGPDEVKTILAGDVPPTPHSEPAALVLPSPDFVDIASDRKGWFRDKGFSQAALIGPALEVDARLRGSPLDDSDRGHGMLFVFRMGGRVPVELQFHFESTDVGGNSGGWGLEYRSLKHDNGLLWGYGLGYSTQRTRDAGDRHTSVHVPVFVALPITTWLVARAEIDLNLLQLDGTGEPGVATQHFSPLLIGAEVPLYKRYFLGATAGYYYGAGDPFVFGGTIGWRLGD